MKKLLLSLCAFIAAAAGSEALADECVFQGTYWEYNYHGQAPCQTWPENIKDTRVMENEICSISWDCPIGGLMPIHHLDWVERGVMTIAPRPGVEITSLKFGYPFTESVAKLADPAEFTPSNGRIEESGYTAVWTGSATNEEPLTITKLTENELEFLIYILVEYNTNALQSHVFNGTGEGRYTGEAPQTQLADLDLSANPSLEVPGVCTLSWPAGQLGVADGSLSWNDAGTMTLTCEKDMAVKEVVFSFLGPDQSQSLDMIFNVSASSGTFYVNNDKVNEAQWIGTADPDNPLKLTKTTTSPFTGIQYVEVKYVNYKKPLASPVFEPEAGEYLAGREVVISSPDKARIIYSTTLDGAAVDTDREYTGPFALDRPGKWKVTAYAVNDESKSRSAEVMYSIVEKLTEIHGVTLKGEAEIEEGEWPVITLPRDIASQNYYKIEGVCEIIWQNECFGYRPTGSYLRIDKDAEISIVPLEGITLRRIIVVGAPYTDSTRALSASFDKGSYTYTDTEGIWKGEVSDRLEIKTKREFYYLTSMTIEYSGEGPGTGIEDTPVYDAPSAYYRLDGTRLNAAPESGLYIRVTGGKAEKLLAR